MAGATYEALFNKFRDSTVISRNEQYARWTLPYLMADLCEVSGSGRVVVERDFQEVGALLTNSLSAKLTSLQFPTQYPFFNASASPVFLQAAMKQGYTENQVSQAFAKMEMDSNHNLFLNSGYAALILAMKYLIVTGNALIYRDSQRRKICAWGLQSFAVRRAGDGTLLDCILREFTTVEALPIELQDALKAAQKAKYSRPEQQVKKYTRIHRAFRNGHEGYEVSQEVDCISVGDATWYPKDLCPWMVPTWVLIPGEHYGRGMVEEYAGGFARLSTLSESSALYAVEMMRVVHLVGAGAGASVDEIADAEHGEYVRGDPAQIQALECGDAQKLAANRQEIERVVTTLARAFMYDGGARDAERVTAYELQRDAQQAEVTLGGVYSSLSGGIQVPLAHILMVEVSDVALTGLISGELRPDVTAGVPALGRAAEIQNFLLGTQEVAAVLQVTQLDDRFNQRRVVDMIYAARSFDTSKVFNTPQEQQAVDQAKQSALAAQASLSQGQALAENSDQITNIVGGP